MMWKSLQMPRSFQKVETGEDGRYAKFVVEALELVGGIVGHDQGDDVADDGGEEAPQDAVAGEVDHGTDEGEVPVVPEVDVDRAGGLGNKHQ